MRSLMMGRTKTTTKIIQTKYLLDIRDEVIGIFPSGFIYFSWVYRIQLNIDNLRRSKKEPKNRTRSLLHFDILNKYTQTCLQGILVKMAKRKFFLVVIFLKFSITNRFIYKQIVILHN